MIYHILNIALKKFNYTLLPNSTGLQNGTNIDFSVDDAVKMNITNTNFDNNEIIYINICRYKS